MHAKAEAIHGKPQAVATIGGRQKNGSQILTGQSGLGLCGAPERGRPAAPNPRCSAAARDPRPAPRVLPVVRRRADPRADHPRRDDRDLVARRRDIPHHRAHQRSNRGHEPADQAGETRRLRIPEPRTTDAAYGSIAPGTPADCQRGTRRCPPKIEEPGLGPRQARSNRAEQAFPVRFARSCRGGAREHLVSSRGSTTDALKLFLDPRQAHVKTIKAGLEALLERLGLTHHGLLLSTSRGTGNNKGHTRRDAADDRNAGHHHHGANKTTRKRDRHMIPIPRGRYGGEGPPETVTPRTQRAARNTSLEQPHGRAADKHHASGHAGDHDDRLQRGLARDRTPGSTHEILLTRDSLRHLQHGRRGFPARDLRPGSCGRRPVRDGARHPRHRCHRPGRRSPPPAMSSAVRTPNRSSPTHIGRSRLDLLVPAAVAGVLHPGNAEAVRSGVGVRGREGPASQPRKPR